MSYEKNYIIPISSHFQDWVKFLQPNPEISPTISDLTHIYRKYISTVEKQYCELTKFLLHVIDDILYYLLQLNQMKMKQIKKEEPLSQDTTE